MRTILSPFVAVVFLAVMVYAALVPVKIDSPGATGMNSNTDIQERKITDASFMVNTNTQSTPGIVQRRYPLHSIGNDSVLLYAAFGYFDFANRNKQIVAVIDGRDSLLGGYRAGEFYYALGADTVAPFIGYSDRFGSSIQETVKTAGFLGAPPYRSVLFDAALFITSKGNVPLVYSPYGAANTSDLFELDTAFFKPNTTSMGLEAPGQLRAGVLNTSGNLSGIYRYAYADFTHGDYGIPSRWVYLDSQQAFVTLFEGTPFRSSDTIVPDGGAFNTAKSQKIQLIRQKYSDSWYALDTFTLLINQAATYVDNKVDGSYVGAGPGTRVHYDRDQDVNNRLIAAFNEDIPGQLRYNSIVDTTGGVPTLDWDAVRRTFGAEDSVYYFTYTYWNPFTGAESPFGPLVKTTGVGGPVGSALADVTVIANDTLCTAWTKGFTKIYERAPWIRVYRSEANDSTVFYPVAQLRANECWPNDSTNDLLQYAVFPGAVHDSMLTAGQPRQVSTDSVLWPYRQALIFTADDGGALVRPPYIEQPDVGFSDLIYANGRVWGIGDPLFPQRIYFTHYDNPYEMNSAVDFFPINENQADELVALEVIPSGVQDVIVAFKHNSMYELIGYDPEYDLSWRTIDNKIGALNRSSVVRFGNAIYFMAMDMRFYEYSGGQPKEISLPIENYIDTLFGNATNAAKTLKVYAMQDKIVLSDTANQRSLVYIPRKEQWQGLEQYASSFRPVGSFNYDSSRTNFSQDQFNYWIYQSDVADRFVVEFLWPTSGAIVDTIAGSTFNFMTKYRTPYVGDGQVLYEIQKVDFTGRWPTGTMYVVIVDGFGVRLDSVAVTDASPPAYRMHTIGLPTHVGSYLALEFVSSTSVQRFDIHGVTMYGRRIGRLAVE